MFMRSFAFFLSFVLLSLLAEEVALSGDISRGLVVSYSFDRIADDNGDVHGTSSTTGHLGREETAFRFDGINDWVGVDHFDCVLNFDKDWSLNLWAYLDGSGKHSTMFAGADGDAGAKQFSVASQYVKMSHRADSDSDWRVNFKEVPHNTWHMYTVTWSSEGHLKVFVDGTMLGEDTKGELNDFCPKNEPIIGAVNFFRKTQHFKGRIDDFRIYERVLSQDDIQSLFTLNE